MRLYSISAIGLIMAVALPLMASALSLANYEDDDADRLSLEDLDALEGALMRQIAVNNRLRMASSPDRLGEAARMRAALYATAGNQMQASRQRNVRKRNYNLDHLARMNFRRSFRANSKFNNRHILGGL